MTSRMVVKAAVVAGGFNVFLLIALVVVLISVLLTPHTVSREDHVGDKVAKELQKLKILSQEADTDLPKNLKALHAIYQKEGNLQKPALHMEIEPNFYSTDDMATLTWHNNHIHHPNGSRIEYKEGTFKILEQGYYFIYSTVRYNGSGTEDLDYGRIVHSVQKSSDETRTPTTLMKNLKSTLVIRRGREAFTTSWLSGTFFLPEGSKVRVLSSIPHNIDTSPHGTIFGLFLM